MRWPVGWVLVVLMAWPACTQNPAMEGEMPSPAAISPSPSVEPSPSPSPTPVAEASPERRFRELALRADGLGLVSFGQPREQVLAELEALLGPPDSIGPGCELAGPDVTTTQFKELYVTFAGDEFIDYHVRVTPDEPRQLGLQTAEGIGLGSTVEELREAYTPDRRLAIPSRAAEILEVENFEIAFPRTDKRLLGTLSGLSDGSVVTGFFTSVCD